MVHSDHDRHFHALNRQLNEEYKQLNWKKLPGHLPKLDSMSEIGPGKVFLLARHLSRIHPLFLLSSYRAGVAWVCLVKILNSQMSRSMVAQGRKAVC